MAEQRLKRRDTTANLALVTPALGAFGLDTTRKAPIQGDGVTAGGIPIPNFGEIINGDWVFGTAVSDNSPDDGDNITVTIDSRYSNFTDGGSLKAGAKIRFLSPGANTGASSLTVSWTGGSDVAAIKKYASGAQADLAASDIVAGQLVEVVFDGTVFQVAGGVGGGGAGGAEVVLAVNTPAAVATSDFLSASFDNATYGAYKFYMLNMRPATANTDLRMRTSTDGGSTFSSTNGDYKWNCWESYAATVIDAYASAGATQAYIEFYPSAIIGNVEADDSQSFEVTLWQAGDTATHTKCMWMGNTEDTNNTMSQVWGVGQRMAAEDVDGVRFYYSSGNIAAGTIVMTGIKKAV